MWMLPNLLSWYLSSVLLYMSCFLYIFICTTVTSRLFTHIVSTEKMRNDLRDRKDPRVTKYTYYNSCF